MSDYNPGTLALVQCSDGEWRRALAGFRSCGDAWTFKDGSYRPADESNARRLVVIDPEDREQVELLTKAVVEACYADGNLVCAENGIHPDTTQRALREFANPKPPKRAAPTGLGAVVEDANGARWVKVSGGRDSFRQSDGDRPGRYLVWDDINAVRVLSEGVQPC